MSETLEGVDLSPDRDVRVTWAGITHPTLDDVREYYRREHITPPWYNPPPMFGLRAWRVEHSFDITADDMLDAINTAMLLSNERKWAKRWSPTPRGIMAAMEEATVEYPPRQATTPESP